MNKKKIIAFIPVRKNSVGFKNKNRKLILNTLKFLNNLKYLEEIYISSDDSYYEKFINEKIIFIKRKKSLSKSTTSIKEVLKDFIEKNKISKNTYIALFYVTIPFKNKTHYTKSINLINNKNILSLCSFIESHVHPYNTYYLEKNRAFQYIKNNIFRRQDLNKAFMQHHYVCIFKSSILKYLNNELFSNKYTYPLIIENKFREKLIEIDSIEDFKMYKKIENFTK